jgi:C1A family cysteine protease
MKTGFDLPTLSWQRDLPDPRDYDPAHQAVRELLGRLKRGRSRSGRLNQVDLREYCGRIEDARCPGPAAACVGLVEYFQRRATGERVELSSPFLHYVTRRLAGGGQEGGELRSTLKALARFGVPPARYWPDEREPAQPDAFLFSLGREFSATCYVRLDRPEATGEKTLRSAKHFLAAGFAVAFGTALPSSLGQEPDIAFPTHFDTILGGHALVAVGYDDDRRIRSSKGALLVRNCWGTDWGEGGYGWLPYRFVQERLAVDFWTLLKRDWLDSGEFQQPL